MNTAEFKATWLPLESGFCRVARYILEDADDAADAVQDLYIKLWNSRDRLDGVLNPQAYGLTMLKNICLDRIRHAKVSRTEPLMKAQVLTGSQESTLAARETVRMVSKAMDRLPDNQRKVLEMRVFDDLEYTEIATRTGLTEGSLRVLLSAARKTLRKIFENERY